MRASTILLLLFLLAGCGTGAMTRSDSGTFVSREVALDGVSRRYQVFVPSRRAGGAHPPVILFLHGAGERGDDGVKPTQVGLGPYVRAHAADFPAIVVFPQSAENGEWGWDPQNADFAFAALEAATKEFSGDRDRTYLTGVSMGGFGTWALPRYRSGLFAALVPVCGGVGRDAVDSPYDEVARQFRTMPVWIFHGAKDDVVEPERSRRMAAALKTAGARDARYTEFPETDHNAWDSAYATPELWTWLFAQRR